MKTFIKWSGNKSKHLKKLSSHLPYKFNTYIEPFVGSGAMFLYIKPQKWIINDLNKDLINVWSQIMNSCSFLISYINEFGRLLSQSITKEEKLRACRTMTSAIDSLKFNTKRAALYLALKNCVYMGILLRDQRYYFRGFDMSFYNKTIPYVLTDKFITNIKSINLFLQSTQGKIMNGDYKKTLALAKHGDFIFIDPPYHENKKYDFKYNFDSVSSEPNLIELHEQINKLNKRGVLWMMTQADTPDIRRTFKEYNISTFDVFRRQSNTHTKELIIKNY